MATTVARGILMSAQSTILEHFDVDENISRTRSIFRFSNDPSQQLHNTQGEKAVIIQEKHLELCAHQMTVFRVWKMWIDASESGVNYNQNVCVMVFLEA